MLGLFKKQLKPDEFGAAVLQYGHELLASDAARSLGTLYDDWDGSKGWGSFLESRGMLRQTQNLHYRLFIHGAMQAASTQFEERTSRLITHGALSSFQSHPDGYDFEATYKMLQSIYRGEHKFDRKIEVLSNPDLQMPNFPNPNIAVLNAKYLIESFVIANVPGNKAYTNGFGLYSATVGQGFGIVIKAMDYILRSFKVC